MKGIITLEQFIVDQQSLHLKAKGSLSKIFRAIELASKLVNRDVRKAGLIDILGNYGSTNVQGEEVKKLDMIANDFFMNAFGYCGEVCAVFSEEEEDMRIMKGNESAEYVVSMDPLDGSSNIDVNASIGTIFSIFKRKSISGEPNLEDCLQKGVDQVAGGYVIYGSSTMMVYTTGQGVNGFTLDDSIQEFCLSHPNISIPSNGKIFSINEGNISEFPEGVKNYLDYCKSQDIETSRPYSARYIGSLIADFHRNLLKGGIFMYPSTAKTPNGKLRLMYECNPMSFIVEQAGGKSSTGFERIMEISPEKLHQRVPLYIGSLSMVEKVEEFLRINH